MEQRMKRFNQIFPIYSGLTGDLIFFVAINTIFMTLVKGVNVEQYVSFTTISSIFCIVFRPLFDKIITCLGITKSLRVGSFLMLLSNIMLTFGTKYVTFVFAIIILEVSLIFISMENVALKNNLIYQHRENDYLKLKEKESFVYSFITAFISLISGFLFSWNHYLPMYLGIVTSVICCLLSFYMFDIGEQVTIEKEKTNHIKVHMNEILRLIIVSYALLYGCVNLAQNNSKLLIQSQMLQALSPEKVAIYLGVIVFISRVIRVLSIICFEKLISIFKDKMILVLSGIYLFFPIFIILGYYSPVSMIFKVLLMAIGFFIVLGVREPFNIYMQDLSLKKCRLEEQKQVVLNLVFARKIGGTVLSVLISLLLLRVPLITVFYLFLIFAIINVCLDYKILKDL